MTITYFSGRNNNRSGHPSDDKKIREQSIARNLVEDLLTAKDLSIDRLQISTPRNLRTGEPIEGEISPMLTDESSKSDVWLPTDVSFRERSESIVSDHSASSFSRSDSNVSMFDANNIDHNLAVPSPEKAPEPRKFSFELPRPITERIASPEKHENQKLISTEFLVRNETPKQAYLKELVNDEILHRSGEAAKRFTRGRVSARDAYLRRTVNAEIHMRGTHNRILKDIKNRGRAMWLKKQAIEELKGITRKERLCASVRMIGDVRVRKARVDSAIRARRDCIKFIQRHPWILDQSAHSNVINHVNKSPKATFAKLRIHKEMKEYHASKVEYENNRIEKSRQQVRDLIKYRANKARMHVELEGFMNARNLVRKRKTRSRRGGVMVDLKQLRIARTRSARDIEFTMAPEPISPLSDLGNADQEDMSWDDVGLDEEGSNVDIFNKPPSVRIPMRAPEWFLYLSSDQQLDIEQMVHNIADKGGNPLAQMTCWGANAYNTSFGPESKSRLMLKYGLTMAQLNEIVAYFSSGAGVQIDEIPPPPLFKVDPPVEVAEKHSGDKAGEEWFQQHYNRLQVNIEIRKLKEKPAVEESPGPREFFLRTLVNNILSSKAHQKTKKKMWLLARHIAMPEQAYLKLKVNEVINNIGLVKERAELRRKHRLINAEILDIAKAQAKKHELSNDIARKMRVNIMQLKQRVNREVEQIGKARNHITKSNLCLQEIVRSHGLKTQVVREISQRGQAVRAKHLVHEEICQRFQAVKAKKRMQCELIQRGRVHRVVTQLKTVFKAEEEETQSRADAYKEMVRWRWPRARMKMLKREINAAIEQRGRKAALNLELKQRFATVSAKRLVCKELIERGKKIKWRLQVRAMIQQRALKANLNAEIRSKNWRLRRVFSSETNIRSKRAHHDIMRLKSQTHLQGDVMKIKKRIREEALKAKLMWLQNKRGQLILDIAEKKSDFKKMTKMRSQLTELNSRRGQVILDMYHQKPTMAEQLVNLKKRRGQVILDMADSRKENGLQNQLAALKRRRGQVILEMGSEKSALNAAKKRAEAQERRMNTVTSVYKMVFHQRKLKTKVMKQIEEIGEQKRKWDKCVQDVKLMGLKFRVDKEMLSAVACRNEQKRIKANLVIEIKQRCLKNRINREMVQAVYQRNLDMESSPELISFSCSRKLPSLERSNGNPFLDDEPEMVSFRCVGSRTSKPQNSMIDDNAYSPLKNTNLRSSIRMGVDMRLRMVKAKSRVNQEITVRGAKARVVREIRQHAQVARNRRVLIEELDQRVRYANCVQLINKRFYWVMFRLKPTFYSHVDITVMYRQLYKRKRVLQDIQMRGMRQKINSQIKTRGRAMKNKMKVNQIIRQAGLKISLNREITAIGKALRREGMKLKTKEKSVADKFQLKMDLLARKRSTQVYWKRQTCMIIKQGGLKVRLNREIRQLGRQTILKKQCNQLIKQGGLKARVCMNIRTANLKYQQKKNIMRMKLAARQYLKARRLKSAVVTIIKQTGLKVRVNEAIRTYGVEVVRKAELEARVKEFVKRRNQVEDKNLKCFRMESATTYKTSSAGSIGNWKLSKSPSSRKFFAKQDSRFNGNYSGASAPIGRSQNLAPASGLAQQRQKTSAGTIGSWRLRTPSNEIGLAPEADDMEESERREGEEEFTITFPSEPHMCTSNGSAKGLSPLFKDRDMTFDDLDSPYGDCVSEKGIAVMKLVERIAAESERREKVEKEVVKKRLELEKMKQSFEECNTQLLADKLSLFEEMETVQRENADLKHRLALKKQKNSRSFMRQFSYSQMQTQDKQEGVVEEPKMSFVSKMSKSLGHRQQQVGVGESKTSLVSKISTMVGGALKRNQGIQV